MADSTLGSKGTVTYKPTLYVPLFPTFGSTPSQFLSSLAANRYAASNINGATYKYGDKEYTLTTTKDGTTPSSNGNTFNLNTPTNTGNEGMLLLGGLLLLILIIVRR